MEYLIIDEIDTNFFIVQNDIVDSNLSDGAYRLWSYIKSKRATNWKINNTDIKYKFGYSDKKLANTWKELIQSGWVIRTKISKQSEFIYTYRLPSKPHSSKSDSSVVHSSVVHSSVKLQSVKNSDYNNTNSINNTNINNTNINNNKKQNFVFDFLGFSDDEIKAINLWIKYKKEKNQSYKSQTSLNVLRNKLLELKKNHCIVDTVNNSISNNWAGLFGVRYSNKNQLNDLSTKNYNQGDF